MGQTFRRLGFAVAAVGIAEDVVARCLASIEEACDTDQAEWEVHVATTVAGHSVRCEAKNRAIAALLDRCGVIVCLDVDCLVPPGLPAATLRAVKADTAFIGLVRDVDAQDWSGWHRYRDYLALPVRASGLGGYVAMTPGDWLAVGGWDERCRGWGGDDVVLCRRMRAQGIRVLRSNRYPLLHVRHPRRDTRKYHYANLALATAAQPNYLTRYRSEPCS